jgi:predicted CopG family antitoxin
MASRTVSLEQSAYERLKAAKRPGESFSVTINRLREGRRPSFRSLAGLLTRSDASELRRAVARMRKDEEIAERTRLTSLSQPYGRHRRH